MPRIPPLSAVPKMVDLFILLMKFRSLVMRIKETRRQLLLHYIFEII